MEDDLGRRRRGKRDVLPQHLRRRRNRDPYRLFFFSTADDSDDEGEKPSVSDRDRDDQDDRERRPMDRTKETIPVRPRTSAVASRRRRRRRYIALLFSCFNPFPPPNSRWARMTLRSCLAAAAPRKRKLPACAALSWI